MLSACTAVSDINSDDEPMDSAQAAIDDSISNDLPPVFAQLKC
jgi:hypothetical protein